jgi:hypothetical protein
MSASRFDNACPKSRRKILLSTLIPICMYCGKTRAANGRWMKNDPRSNFPSHVYSHGICPDCEPRMFADMQGDGISNSPA